MRNESVRRKNWMLRIAAVLLIMVLVSTHMVSGLFARYTTTASGSDGARVAKFQITESLLNEDDSVFTSVAAGVVPNVPCEVEVAVDNASEVAVTYEIAVGKASDNLPLKFYVIPDEGGAVNLETIAASAQSTPYSFSGSINPTTTKTYSMYVLWTPANEAEALANMGMVDMITLELSATQID